MNKKSTVVFCLLSLLSFIPLATAASVTDMDQCTALETNDKHGQIFRPTNGADGQGIWVKEEFLYTNTAVEAACVLMAQFGKCHRDHICTAAGCDYVAHRSDVYDPNMNVVVTPKAASLVIVPQVRTMDYVVNTYWIDSPTVSCT